MKIKRKNRHFPNGLTASKTIIILYLIAGWNLISFSLAQNDTGTDRNISLISGQNLISYSSATPLTISSAKFINSTDSEFTWAEAVAAGKVQNYISYFDNTPDIPNKRRFKYIGINDNFLREGKGYWLYTNEAGKIKLPGIGGTLNATTYNWSDLRFEHSNGTQLNVSEAGSSGWIVSTLQWWNPNKFGGADFETVSSGNLNSWRGYYIESKLDNITLLRQN